MRILFIVTCLFLLSACGVVENNEISNKSCLNSIYENVQSLTCPLKASAFNPRAIYAEQLIACTFNDSQQELCRINQLPLLGQETVTPSLDQLMDRVIAEQPWMANNFKSLLERHPALDDILLLSRSLTAVVISHSIRPSHFNTGTAAIYLDPAYLWFTKEEFDSVSEVEDYRSDFGNELQFEILWRLTTNNQSILTSNFTFYGDRTNDERVVAGLSRLLYHELSHANDYFSKDFIQTLSNNDTRTYLQAYYSHQIVSEKLVAELPLQSDLLTDLASVKYLGHNASNTEKATTANEVAADFAADSAANFYSYTTPREDLAKLFEFAMMRLRFNAQVDISVSSIPNNTAELEPSDYVVTWGQRDRVVAPELQARLRLIIEAIIPELLPDYDSFIATAGVPTVIAPGTNWTDSSLLTPSNKTLSGQSNELEIDWEFMRHDH